ncbi:hypothetical protein CCP3SC1AL1_110007 [Gammaproteobacteria bacterium]
MIATLLLFEQSASISKPLRVALGASKVIEAVVTDFVDTTGADTTG